MKVMTLIIYVTRVMVNCQKATDIAFFEHCRAFDDQTEMIVTSSSIKHILFWLYCLKKAPSSDMLYIFTP